MRNISFEIDSVATKNKVKLNFDQIKKFALYLATIKEIKRV